MNDLNCSLLTEVGDLVGAAAAQAGTETAQGVGYTDLIVNPSHWGAWGHRPQEMLEALDQGFSRAEAGGPVRTGLSLSIGRHVTAEAAEVMVAAMVESGIARVVGVSIDGNDWLPGTASDASPPAVAAAREAGLHIAVHTGESGGVDHIWRNLEVLSPDRIDHGVRSVEDPRLVAELARRGTTLAMCPTSNLVLGVVASLGEHPIDLLRRAGVPVTVNTDDPMVFGTDLLREYEIAADSVRVGPRAGRRPRPHQHPRQHRQRAAPSGAPRRRRPPPRSRRGGLIDVPYLGRP